jgi:hypothetical protein
VGSTRKPTLTNFAKVVRSLEERVLEELMRLQKVA